MTTGRPPLGREPAEITESEARHGPLIHKSRPGFRGQLAAASASNCKALSKYSVNTFIRTDCQHEVGSACKVSTTLA